MVVFNCTAFLSDPHADSTQAHWCSGPHTRDTFNIFWSCASTLFITVWTSIHFDVPVQTRNWKQSLWSRLKWMTLGLLAPELLLWIAWNQFVCAVKVLDVARRTRFRTYGKPTWSIRFLLWAVNPKIGKSAKELDEEYSPSRSDIEASKHASEQPLAWTLVHSFYACTGGFVFDIPHESCVSEPRNSGGKEREQLSHSSKVSPAGTPESSVSELGVSDEKEHQQLPDSFDLLGDGHLAAHSSRFGRDENTHLPGYNHVIDSYDNICGRKVITPAGFCFLLRAHPDLIPPVSAAHIAAMSKSDTIGKVLLIWQVFWFLVTCISHTAHLSLLEIVTITHAVCTILACLLWMHKPLNVAEPTPIIGNALERPCAVASPGPAPCDVCAECLRNRAGSACALMAMNSPRGYEHFLAVFGVRYRPESRYAEYPFLWCRASAADIFLRRLAFWKHSPPWYYEGVALSVHQQHSPRWERAWSGMGRAQHAFNEQAQPQDAGNTPQAQLVKPNSSLQAFLASQFTRDLAQSIQVALISTVYGSLHLLAWDSHFPSLVERTIWRVAPFVMCAGGLARVYDYSVRRPADVLHWTRGWRSLVFALPVYIAICAYIIASATLIVLSIRQLLFLPPDAYTLDSWTLHMPHIS